MLLIGIISAKLKSLLHTSCLVLPMTDDMYLSLARGTAKQSIDNMLKRQHVDCSILLYFDHSASSFYFV
jgi:hypothetical protein